MQLWKEFEKECFNYLIENYGSICSFESFGESDSTYSDVKVIPFCGEPFYIEIKESLAQCGQFVLFPNEEERIFQYSRGNKSSLNEYSQQIINYMNCHFDTFINAGTRGQGIVLPENIFYGWIKRYYSAKGVKFFITKGTEYVIFPIEKFEKYFSVSATYRVKKSGSSDPSKVNISEIKNILDSRKYSYELVVDGKKIFVETAKEMDGLKLRGMKYTYLFNQITEGNYNIRKLSNTQNANVIFSIQLKKEQDKRDLQAFEQNIY